MNLAEYTLSNPLFALMEGVDEKRSQKYTRAFIEAPEEIRELLTSEEVAETIQLLIDDGTVSPKYRTALAKIVALVGLGDIPVSSVPALLLKLGVPEANATRVSRVLDNILATLDTLRTLPETISPLVTPKQLIEVPPLQVTTPQATESQGSYVRPSVERGSTEVSGPNVLNLRKEPEERV